MQVKKQVRIGHEQRTGPKSGKEYMYTVYYNPDYLTYMQSTSWEMLDWMKHKLEWGFPGRHINNLSFADDTTLMAKSEEELRDSWWKLKRTVKKLA